MAVIAGCTIAGAVVGALAGPKVAKVAKKVASAAKKKITKTAAKVAKATKNTAKKVKPVAKKVASKTKTALTSSKAKAGAKTITKASSRAIKKGVIEGTINVLTDTSQKKTSNTIKTSFKKGFVNGVTGSVISDGIGGWKGAAIAGATTSLMDSIRAGDNIRVTAKNMALKAISQGTTDAMLGFIGVNDALNQMSESDLLENKIGRGMLEWMSQMFGVGVDTTVMYLGNL